MRTGLVLAFTLAGCGGVSNEEEAERAYLGLEDGLRRVDGTTHITGTATSDYGVFDVDVTR